MYIDIFLFFCLGFILENPNTKLVGYVSKYTCTPSRLNCEKEFKVLLNKLN